MNSKPTYKELEDRVKELEIQLQDSLEKEYESRTSIQVLMDCTPGITFIKNRNLNYVNANRNFYDLYKIPYDQIQGKTDYDIFPLELAKKYNEDDLKILESGLPLYVEEMTLDKNIDRGIYMATRKIPWFDDRGNICGIYGISFDISEIKLAQERLELKEKELNYTKDKFFSIIGHDIRVPIGNIKMLIDLTLIDFQLSDKQQIINTMQDIQKRASSTCDLLENLLFWAKSQLNEIDYRPSEFNLFKIFENSISELKETSIQKGVTIYNLIPENHIIIANPNRIKTVFRNLISNAIMFSPNNKKIFLTIKKEKRNWIVAVIHEDISICAVNLQKLTDNTENFSNPRTYYEKGSGLGLILCNEFIQKQDGNVWEESELGKETNLKVSSV
ncbi:MAG: PAS domain-containing sensor histidine kinase [Leptospiraceae bacterium]|nr:PAS domain-containing sensor histidine kinase [Leptospiraceae bacterium]